MRRKLIVGNWKMNGTMASMDEARAIAAHAAEQPQADVALCPPFPLIAPMVAAVPGLRVGAQDCHAAPSGAFTGSVAAPMLVDCGAQLVIVGHSERRTGCGESDADVQAKFSAALDAGLDVILCVGEPLEVREAGNATSHVLAQVDGSLPTGFAAHASRIAIAYEPIWAIGTGRTAQPADVAEMHAAIRGALGTAGSTVRILYGGSVTGETAPGLFQLDDVDGALVGGASLRASSFAPIIAAA